MAYSQEMSLRALSEVWSYLNCKTGDDKILNEGLSRFKCRFSSDDAYDSEKIENDPNCYLRCYALNDEQSRRCKTYLVVDDEAYREGRLDIVAYFTISVSVFDISVLSDTTKRLLLGAKPSTLAGNFVPAYLIAQLARSGDSKWVNFNGASLLGFAEDTVERASELVGGSIIYLQCCDELIGYYEALGYTHVATIENESAPNNMVKLIPADLIVDDLSAILPEDET